MSTNLSENHSGINEDDESLVNDTNKSVDINVNVNVNSKQELPANSHSVSKYLSHIHNCWQNIIEACIILIAVLLYLKSLEGCHEKEIKCVESFSLSLFVWAVIIIALSGVIFTMMFFLYFLGHASRFAFYTSLCVLLFLSLIYDTGNDLQYHGAYNRIILFVSMIISSIFMCMLYFIVHLFKKFHLNGLVGVILIFLLTGFYIKHIIDNAYANSCANWSKGFKDTQIENSPQSLCNIYPPKVCYLHFLLGLFDFSKFFFETCENLERNQYSRLQQLIHDKTAKLIGYPRTENWKIFPDSQDEYYQTHVLNNLINMEDPNISQEIKNRTEITVNFHEPRPVVKIQIKRNETLVAERKKLFTKTPLAPNVILFFMDSLSRFSVRNKLPKFYKWLESHYIKDDNNNYTYQNVKFETFQFLKHHGVGRYTGQNMVPALFGVFNIYYSGKYFLTHYKNNGYITGQALDWCGREVFSIGPGAIENMSWDTYDHEMASLHCDPNFAVYGYIFSKLSGTNSIRKRCLYDKSAQSYVFEYARQFFNVYKNEPKFFRVALYEGHEGTGEVIKYSDEELTDFFIEFERLGYFDNAIVFIQSDHGLSMVGPFSYWNMEDYHKELVLPAFYLLLPTNIKNYAIIRETVRYNENSMTSPFLIYNSLLTVLNAHVDYSPFAGYYDLFDTKIPRRVSCSSFYDDIYYTNNEFMCRCNEK